MTGVQTCALPILAKAAFKAFDQVPSCDVKSLLANALFEFGVHMAPEFRNACETLSKPVRKPEPEPEPEPEEKTKTARKRAAPAVLVSVDEMVADGVDRQNALDWLTNRKAKKLPLTPSAWSDAKSEAEKAGMTVAEAIQRSAAQGWGGFKAKWLTEDHGRNGQKPAVELWAGAK